jgi:hypothetical protein
MCTVPDTKRDAYNGWTNRETWAVGLWINNDQGLQESVHDALHEYTSMAADEPLSPSKAGEVVHEYLEDLFDLDNYEDGGFSRELQTMREDIGSMWRVDWREVGAAFLRDAQEQDQ